MRHLELKWLSYSPFTSLQQSETCNNLELKCAAVIPFPSSPFSCEVRVWKWEYTQPFLTWLITEPHLTVGPILSQQLQLGPMAHICITISNKLYLTLLLLKGSRYFFTVTSIYWPRLLQAHNLQFKDLNPPPAQKAPQECHLGRHQGTLELLAYPRSDPLHQIGYELGKPHIYF